MSSILLEPFFSRLETVFQQSDFSGSAKPVVERGFLISNLYEKPYLFLGHNPSYRVADKTPFHGYASYEPHERDSYYKHFFDIAKAAGIEDKWNYLDTFYYRETDQKWVPEDETTKWIRFLCQQLIVTQDILESLSPRLIVVSNSGAGRFLGIEADEMRNLGVWMGYKFEWDEYIGTYRIKTVDSRLGRTPELTTTNLKDVPVVFSSFNQYQSKGNRERLEWHLRHVLKCAF